MATVNQSRNLRYMVVQAETAAGTMETDVATGDHVIRIRDIDIQPNIEFDDENAKYANGSHAEDESIAGQQSVTITCSTRVTYGGAVATQPQWWKLANACGLTSIGWNAGTEVAVGSGVEGVGLVGRKIGDDTTYTIWVVDQTIGSTPIYTIYKCAGCMGNMVLTATNGGPVMANFTFQGKLNDIVDGSDIALNASTQTALAQNYMGVNNNFTYGGVDLCVSEWQFDCGNVVNPILCQSDASGISHYYIAERRPRFSANPLAVKQATATIGDVLANVLAETTNIVQAKTTNFTLKALDCQTLSPALADREGLVNWGLNFKCIQNGVPGTLIDAALDLEDTFELLQGARS